MVSLGVRWILLKDIAIKGLSLGQMASLVGTQCLLEYLRDGGHTTIIAKV